MAKAFGEHELRTYLEFIFLLTLLVVASVAHSEDAGHSPSANSNQVVVPFDGGRFVVAKGERNECVVAFQGLVNKQARFKFDDVVTKASELGCAPRPSLLLESPGGSLTDGILMGRQVRAGGFTTIARYECASACAALFVGGVERILWGSRAAIGLHQATLMRETGSTTDENCVQSSLSDSSIDMRRYFEFAIPAHAERVFKIFMDTPCKSIEWIAGQRALDLGLATKITDGDRDVFGPKKGRQVATPSP